MTNEEFKATAPSEFAFLIKGGVGMPQFRFDRSFWEASEALEYARQVAAEFAGSRNVYGINVFRGPPGPFTMVGWATIDNPRATVTTC